MSNRDTGFPEPLSTERNTTLPYTKTQEAQVLDQSTLGSDKLQQKAEAAKQEMYAGLQEKDEEEVDGKTSKVKKVLGKLGHAS